MKVIKITNLALKTPGPARSVGEKLAEKVKPGDIIDLENDSILLSHSFWDGFSESL